MNHRFLEKEVVALFLNGTPPKIYCKKKHYYKKIFSVDGAFHYIKKIGVKVDFFIGDFDSFPKKNLPSFGNNVLEKKNQNQTDFEKALNIIYKKGFFNINVWGGSGKEQDHFLGNLSTALKYKKKLSIIFHDDYHSYFFSDKKNFFYQKKNKKISLFPFPEVEGIFTRGLKYPISNGLLKIGEHIGIRNEACKNKIEISYQRGELLIFIEK